jgi:hypothetical protein
MKVGTVVQLKCECLKNPAGAVGIVFNDYGDGIQVIFENGKYDGFSLYTRMDNNHNEIDFFLNKIGFSKELAGYEFKSVMQVSQDFLAGQFDNVLKHRNFEGLGP